MKAPWTRQCCHLNYNQPHSNTQVWTVCSDWSQSKAHTHTSARFEGDSSKLVHRGRLIYIWPSEWHTLASNRVRLHLVNLGPGSDLWFERPRRGVRTDTAAKKLFRVTCARWIFQSVLWRYFFRTVAVSNGRETTWNWFITNSVGCWSLDKSRF